jgi:hypothetical protein
MQETLSCELLAIPAAAAASLNIIKCSQNADINEIMHSRQGPDLYAQHKNSLVRPVMGRRTAMPRRN